ncbi:MAG: hypothetical protein WA395_06835 [Nitrososphaeraceae archaeon]
MTNITDSPTEVETGSYLTVYLYRVPKRNHDVITQNLKKFIPWFEKNGVRLEYYNLAGRETQEVVDSSKAAGMEGMESIAKTLAAEDEDIWMELQYFRDHSHCKEVFAKMMTDKSLEPLLNEFFGLVTQGRGLITGGFNRLRH